MEPDDLRSGRLLEVAHYRVANHLIQFLNGVGDREDRLTERLGGVSALGGSCTMKMISFTPPSIIKQSRRRGSLEDLRVGGKQ